MRIAWRLAAALACLGTGARAADIEAGASATGGSHGYWRAGVFSDFDWPGPQWSPFLTVGLSKDTYSRELRLTGGSWKSLTESVSVKGALGLIAGRFDDADESGRALTLETGAERRFTREALGADYRLTTGTIGTVRESRSSGMRLRDRGRRRVTMRTETETQRSHELSGYGRVPAGTGSVTLRLTLGLLSYAGPVLTETLSAWVPLGEDWSLNPALSFDQGSTSGAYVTIGFSRAFR